MPGLGKRRPSHKRPQVSYMAKRIASGGRAWAPSRLNYIAPMLNSVSAARGNSTVVKINQIGTFNTSPLGTINNFVAASQVITRLGPYNGIFETFEVLRITMSMIYSGQGQLGASSGMPGGNMICFVDVDSHAMPGNIVAAGEYATAVHLPPNLSNVGGKYVRSVAIPKFRRPVVNQLTGAPVFNVNNADISIGIYGDVLPANIALYYVRTVWTVRLRSSV